MSVFQVTFMTFVYLAEIHIFLQIIIVSFGGLGVHTAITNNLSYGQYYSHLHDKLLYCISCRESLSITVIGKIQYVLVMVMVIVIVV